MASNLIISGNKVPTKWGFKSGIEKGSGKKWSTIICQISDKTGIKRITRYIKYILFPICILIKRKDYNRILSKNFMFGLILAFYARLFKAKNMPDLYIMAFEYDEGRGFFKKIYHKFISYAISAEFVKKIIVFSKYEESCYGDLFFKNKDKFVYEMLGIQDISSKIKANQYSWEYYVASGKNDRDYDFILDNWTEKEPLYVVTDSEKENRTSEKVYYMDNCFEEDFLSLIKGAIAVIIPFKNKHIMSEILIILQSGMLGVPCIVTGNDAVSDYIENGANGYIINKDGEELKRVLSLMEDQKALTNLKIKSRETFEKKFGLYEMGVRIGKLIGE